MTTTLALALVAVAVLAGLGPAFPSGVNASSAWSFLGGHGYALAHALLGTLVLLQAVALVVVARARLLPVVILGGIVLAAASGVAYVSSRQPGAALGLMTAGWLVSLTAAVVEAVKQRRQLKAGR